jgi:quinol monooxygenase YgiN
MMTTRWWLMLIAIAALGAGALILLPVRGDDPLGGGKKRMHGMIGKMTAVEGKRDDLISILLQGSKGMPRCLSYVVAKDPADTTTVWVTEVWEDQASHRASLSLPAVKEAIAKGKPLIARFDRSVITEPVGGLGLTPEKSR